MKYLLLLFPALLLVLAAPASAQEDPIAAEGSVGPGQPEGPDILKVTPEEILGTPSGNALAGAHRAYQEGKYAEAARLYIEVLRRTPGDANSVYNLACCFGLMGAEEQAARFLEAAFRTGFGDLGHAARDPDFEKVRESAPFRAAFERLQKRDAEKKAAAGKPLLVTSRVLTEVRVVEPAEMRPGERYPVLIGLHGYGDNGENFVTLFSRRKIKAPFLFVVPQAPYAFSPGPRIGYSWGRWIEGIVSAGIRSQELSVAYVLDVLEAVKREYPVDERNVFLMGFSQGAGMAFSVGMRHPGLFRGVIPIGGWLDEKEHPADRVRRAKKLASFLVCHSPEDRVVPFDGAEAAVEFLEQAEIRHRLVRYAGGHSLPEDLMRKIAAWMNAPEAEPVEKAVVPNPEKKK